MTVLHNIFTSLNKRVKKMDEEFSMKDYIEPHASNALKIEKNPFPFVVIDNIFKPSFVEALTEVYSQVFSKGLAQDSADTNRFHLFEEKINYDGYVYSPPLTLDLPLGLFFSIQWNTFFSKLFRKPTTFGTNFAFHHHPTGDRSGWIHHDYATHVFPHKFILPNGVTASRGEDNGKKLSRGEMLTRSFKQKRSIALIYYFNNPEWKEGDGGETALYGSKNEADVRKKIAPINNRLLAFDVSPISFHAFQQNTLPRNSIVQWFHSDLDWCEKKYGFL